MSTKRMVRNTLLAVTAAVVVSLALLVASASAYNGEFCYHIYLWVHAAPGHDTSCTSNTESDLRRAIGNGADWTQVIVSGTGGDGHFHEAGDQCYSDGCGADTGYLPEDVTGNGFIQNIGDPCSCGGGYYYGWLYP